MATIKCISDCQFATIEKNDYQRVLRKIEIKAFNQKIDFFNSIPHFKFLTSNMIKKFIHSFVVKYYKINQNILQQGAEPAQVYIVLDGEFEIIKRINEDKGTNILGSKQLLSTGSSNFRSSIGGFPEPSNRPRENSLNRAKKLR